MIRFLLITNDEGDLTNFNNVHIIVESPLQHYFSCFCSLSDLLLSYYFSFSLLFVSHFFFINGNFSIDLKFKVVACVTNINENCKNVCFEGKALNQHDTFDYLHSSKAKRNLGSNIYLYLILMLSTILLVAISLVRHFSSL